MALGEDELSSHQVLSAVAENVIRLQVDRTIRLNSLLLKLHAFPLHINWPGYCSLTENRFRWKRPWDFDSYIRFSFCSLVATLIKGNWVLGSNIYVINDMREEILLSFKTNDTQFQRLSLEVMLAYIRPGIECTYPDTWRYSVVRRLTVDNKYMFFFNVSLAIKRFRICFK